MDLSKLSDRERLIAEQAVETLRALDKVADDAPYGQGLACMEACIQRIHIFWQRRIGANDTNENATPYWFPAQTGSGSLREDRLVLPIPPGTHWRDVMPLVLPGVTIQPTREVPKALPGGAPIRPRPEQPKLSVAQKAAIQRSHSRHLAGVPLGKKAVITAGGIKYVERTDYV
ncbi:MAG: hypothetical protein M3478_02785, partial [Planctomycetota bacterium]|nr:hypothetical protein [Planctomycetota bacterium]